MGDNFKGVPVIGVVESAAEAAVSITKNKRIGLIATAASVKSGAYAESLKRKLPEVKVFANAAPMFVPLVENGRFNRGDRLALLAAEEYLAPLLENGIDTLILGCTHYPFLSDVISDICGAGVTLINPAAETVKRAKDLLSDKGLLKQGTVRGETKFFVSSDIESFQTLATMFLGDTYNTIPTLIDIDRY
jgi:glutamate racemase